MSINVGLNMICICVVDRAKIAGTWVVLFRGRGMVSKTPGYAISIFVACESYQTAFIDDTFIEELGDS